MCDLEKTDSKDINITDIQYMPHMNVTCSKKACAQNNTL